MIQPIKFNSNTNFTALSPALQAQIDAQKNEESKKFSITDAYTKTKKGVTDVVKGVNTTAGVASGIVKGAVGGVLAAGAVGLIGKNYKIGEGQIIGTFKGIVKDLWKGLATVPKALKNVFWSKPMKENLADGFKAIGNGIKKIPNAFKNYRGTAVVATIIGLGVFAFSAIKGKVEANQKNANIDHSTNQGHVK